MKILYIFPHPDDESFGPAPVISHQQRQGHEISLLTLTRGGATKVRHDLGFSVEEMGRVRYREMLDVADILELSEMMVLDMPDGRLKDFDPFMMEAAITGHILRLQPSIVVTYPVHGISGFHDHLVTHAVVKRTYMEMVFNGARFLKRLAFFTIPEPETQDGPFHLNGSKPEDIDCVVEVEDEDMERFNRALDCYKTYASVIERTNIKQKISRQAHFEIYQESYDPPLKDLTEQIRV